MAHYRKTTEKNNCIRTLHLNLLAGGIIKQKSREICTGRAALCFENRLAGLSLNNLRARSCHCRRGSRIAGGQCPRLCREKGSGFALPAEVALGHLPPAPARGGGIGEAGGTAQGAGRGLGAKIQHRSFFLPPPSPAWVMKRRGHGAIKEI